MPRPHHSFDPLRIPTRSNLINLIEIEQHGVPKSKPLYMYLNHRFHKAPTLTLRSLNSCTYYSETVE